MTDELVTFRMHGPVTLAQFRDALDRFNELAEAVAAEVAPDQPFDWIIEELEAGSAKAAFATVTPRAEYGSEVRRSITEALEAAQRGRVIPFGRRITVATRRVTGLVGNQAEALDVETDFGSVGLATPPLFEMPPRQATIISFGMIKGEVDAATRSKGLFVVFMEPDIRPVYCSLAGGRDDEPLLHEIFGKRVRVQGDIERERTTGRVHRVRNVARQNVEVLRSGSTSFERALGVFRVPPGTPPPEERRGRWDEDA